jgi:hypothetical protein
MKVHTRPIKYPKVASDTHTGSIPSPSDGGMLHLESDMKLLGVSEDDKTAVFQDAVCNDQLALVNSLWPDGGKCPGIFEHLVHFAAWKASPDMVELLFSRAASTHPGLNYTKNALLATAIETENLPNIKLLLSLGSNMVQEFLIAPEIFGQIPLRRCGRFTYKRPGEPIDIYYDNITRAFSLWSPDLMRYLIDECGITLPSALAAPGRIFDHPGFRKVDPEDVVRRLEAMKRYILWPDAYTNGLQYVLRSGPKEALIFCLDNGADPNTLVASGKHILERAFSYSKYTDLAANLALLLRYGADPEHPNVGDLKSKCPKKVQSLESQYGISWEEFAARVKAGESLEVIRGVRRE